MKLLHIAAHVGGGIGSAYAGLGLCGQEQSILLLEPPADRAPLARIEQEGFRILRDVSAAAEELQKADLVVFSWHHHPALAKFLHDFPMTPIRSMLWCHVSGNYFPQIPAGFVRLFDQCMFAAPYSLELPQIQALGSAYAKEHFQVVYGLNDLERFHRIRLERHTGFRIGYAGTLGFCKLHPEFVDFCAAVDVKEAVFPLIGIPTSQKELTGAARERGIAGKLEFQGQLDDVSGALAKLDLFAYLLNPQHFGATENALLEAMAAGLPVVALEQCVEQRILRDGVTGLLVHSPEEFGKAVRFLYENPARAAQLGQNARRETRRRYRIIPNRERFLSACRRAMAAEKKIPGFRGYFSGDPADWFLAGVKEDRDCFEEGHAQDAGRIFRENTKGSPLHYHAYFPEDKRLSGWAAQIKNDGKRSRCYGNT